MGGVSCALFRKKNNKKTVLERVGWVGWGGGEVEREKRGKREGEGERRGGRVEKEGRGREREHGSEVGLNYCDICLNFDP